MLATRRLLAAVLAEDREDELITTPARREVLREHLYRELTKGTYTPDERKLWADRLQRLLDGKVKAEVRCHLIDVRLGVDASTLHDRTRRRSTTARSASPRASRELNEELIDALHDRSAASEHEAMRSRRPDGEGPRGPPEPDEPATGGRRTSWSRTSRLGAPG